MTRLRQQMNCAESVSDTLQRERDMSALVDHLASLGSDKPLPSPFNRVTVKAWALGDKGAVELEINAGRTVDDVAAGFASFLHYGRTIAVVASDTFTKTDVLHVFKITRGSWLGCYEDTTDGQLVRKYPYSARLLFPPLPVNAFDPVINTPWQWTPGCDVVGAPANQGEGL